MAPNQASTSTSYPKHETSTLPDQPLIRPSNITTTNAAVLDFKKECDRRKTYDGVWPLTFLDPNRLAAAGFYFRGKADLVRCAFCNTEIGKWEEGDDPMRDHQRWSPNCPFVKNQNVGNVACSREEAPSSTSTSLTQGSDTCGPYGIEVRSFSGSEAPCTSTSLTQGRETCGPYGIVVRPFSGPESPSISATLTQGSDTCGPYCKLVVRPSPGLEAASISTLSTQGSDTCGPYYEVLFQLSSRPENALQHMLFSKEKTSGIIKLPDPAHKEYSTKEARLRSYKYWPKSLKQTPTVLSDAGFFYTGRGDHTVCFHCGEGMKDWEDSDDPWVEHALWFPNCMFVYEMKGQTFINQVVPRNKKN